MTSVMYFLSLLVALVIAVLGELISDEVRARLDRLPLALLSAAARRLSPEQRDELYERAWFPELHHILRGDQATPITRLIHGMRYAVRLWLAAPQIMRELEPDHAPRTLSKRVLQFVFAPDYVVVYRMTGLPIASATATYAIRHSSWVCGVVALWFVADAAYFAILGKRRLILTAPGGHLPSQDVYCHCRVGIICRSLALPANVVCTSVATILAFKVASISAWPIADLLTDLGCLFVPLLLQRRGFLLGGDSHASGQDSQATG